LEIQIAGITGYVATKSAQMWFCRAEVAIFWSRFPLSLLIYSISYGNERESSGVPGADSYVIIR
jgi:hypothetical protein